MRRACFAVVANYSGEFIPCYHDIPIKYLKHLIGIYGSANNYEHTMSHRVIFANNMSL